MERDIFTEQSSGAQNKAIYDQSLTKTMHYDELTGLKSMTAFFESGDHQKDAILEEGGRPMLLYVDFKGMKFFNAKYGFAEGDKILQAFADLLSSAFSHERCCRIGADHFAVITEEKDLEEKLYGIFNDFKELHGGKTPPVHVGIYPYRLEDVHVSSACDKAKLASVAIKDAYNSAFNYFSTELSEDALKRQYIIENIDTAIREKWIQVYIQPIIRTVNGKICDVEALARWIDPEKGILSPASFIPALEDARLIYKLDLYMVDQILEIIKTQITDGFTVVSHSINLSRSDFDACDIVEEIRKKVDAAGIARDRITIEITESIIGRDFDFMKEQIKRFRSLGFPVWMDDFGSGYSSLDVLQSIKFDLIKFDMSFMRKLDEGENGKIILTELMRMATSLGVDTVCEGVETEAQVRFLQEIGCSKLQGYYFSKPMPFENILKMHRDKTIIETENEEESDYYQSIGRVNLFDLGVIASSDSDAFQNTFSTIPIAILEINGNVVRYIRSNRSYRSFIKRFFDIDTSIEYNDFRESNISHGTQFFTVIDQCINSENNIFFNEKMPDGSVVHSFARQVNVNPVTGTIAVVIAVLSVAEPDENTTYADIARSLAADYYNIFVVDLDTDNYIEYSSKVGGEELSIERHGASFFESARYDAMTRIYDEDRGPFLKWFTKENVLHELDTQGVFTTTYRLIDTGTPTYVNMKTTRMKEGNRIIIGVSIVDAQMKQQEEEKKLRQERISLGRIAALSPYYIVLYTVDIETGSYTQYNPSYEFEKFGLAHQGEDFFTDVKRDAAKAIDPKDIETHLRVLTKENMMREIQEHGVFVHNYRLIMDGKSVPVSLKASLVEEDDGEKIILGVSKIDTAQPKYELEMLRIQRENAMNKEAYEQARNDVIIYTHIAHALARGYTDLYYVNMETNELIEYYTDDESGVLTELRRGKDFFEGCERDAKLYVHHDDQAIFVRTMNKTFLRDVLRGQHTYEFVYRRIKGSRTFYVKMQISRIEEDENVIVIAVSDIDELMRQRRAEERIQEERIIYARLHALTGNFICVYVVDIETDSYREFSATDAYVEKFAQAKEGGSFFSRVREVAHKFNHPDDLKRFLASFTKENVLAEIERRGIFTLGYRLMMEERPIHVQMKAAMVEEKEGPRLIVGLNDIDAQVRQEEEYIRQLAKAQNEASIDALTGVKNKHAYLEVEAHMDHQILEHRQSPFAIVMLDINDLKKVNDTYGHQAGDKYLHDACEVICDVFKHSPVFRVGGDEFAVIAQGKDYASISELIGKMSDHNELATKNGGIVIACGMARFENDGCVASVFERADHMMYKNKNALKSARKR